MKILSHRGYWLRPEEKNTSTAFARSIANGFGTETDVRDFNGSLVVSHDPPTGNQMSWSNVAAAVDGTGLRLAVNVKADGLASLLSTEFTHRKVDWFAFDMSGPETLRYAQAGMPYYTRQSDIEPEPILYESASGVWLDAFQHVWFDENTIKKHLHHGKAVCVVSPELHGKSPDMLWQMLASLPSSGDIAICTDFPDRAAIVFAP